MRIGRLARLGVLAVAGVSLAACSSSGASSTATTAKSSSTSGSAGSGLAQAEATTAKWLKAPTTIGITTPLKTAPPTGKTIVWLECELSDCKNIASGFQAAAQAVGWTVKTINYQSSNPATLQTALQTALQYNPVAVSFSGLPYATWSNMVPAYQKAGVMMIPQYIGPGVPVNSTIPLQIGGSPDVTQYGQIIGNFFVSDSKGKGDALVVGVPSFPVLVSYVDAFNQTVASLCPGCTTNQLSLTIPQIDAGQVNAAIVAALQKDPKIDYVSVSDGVFINGLPSALQAAGLANRVKVIGESASVEQRQELLSGQAQAFTGLATPYGGWVAVDAAIRHLEGMPIDPTGGGLPKQLLTKATVGNPVPPFGQPTNYPQQFKKLWKLG